MILDNNNDSNQRHSRVQSNYKRQKTVTTLLNG